MGILSPNLRPDLDAIRADLAAEVLRNIVKDGWSILNMSAGIADAFTDQTGISALGGAQWDATGKYLHNKAQTKISQATGTAFGNLTDGGGLGAIFNGSTAESGLSAAYTATQVAGGFAGKAWGSARQISGFSAYPQASGYFVGSNAATYQVRLYGKNGAPANATDGTALYTSASIPRATVAPIVVTSGITQASYTHHWVAIIPSTAETVLMAEAEFWEGFAGANVAVRSVSFAADSQVTFVRLTALWEPVDTCSLATDCILSASTNGGASYVAVPAIDLGKFDATTRIIGGVAALPAGSAVRWAWDTANSKQQRLRGVWEQWR